MSNNKLREKLEKDILLLDGAFGTYAQFLGLSEDHFKDIPGCMEYLSVSSPEFIRKIHSDYLEAGADAVETNTFGGNRLKLQEFSAEEKVYELNYTSTKIARETADKISTKAHPRFVIGAMGPTGKLPSSTDKELGDIGYNDLKTIFSEQALGIIDGGADALLIETGQDLLEMKAAVNGAKEALSIKNKDLLIMAQCTLSNNGRMLLGTEISAVSSVLSSLGVDVVGVNCSTGPVEMESTIKYLSQNCPTYISCIPNAGLPIEKNGETVYTLESDEMAELVRKFLNKYRINIIGGCCGTSPEYIRKIREVVDQAKQKKPGEHKHFFTGFYKGFDLAKSVLPIKVGERINTHGSKKMKELLKANDYDGIIEMGKQQETQGADILDVCTVLTERKTEKDDTVIIFKNLAESVQAPLMVDSTDVEVIKAALENYPGTAFINSINLEDGGLKADAVLGLAKDHGSFIVSLVIDEKGMAKTVKRKLEIAEKIFTKAVEKFQIQSHRIIFDMLTFTLGTGEKEYMNSALDTFEAIKLIKQRHPEVLTVLGVSNASFGLPRQGRKVLNRLFLHHAVKNGLDLCIINPVDYLRLDTIPENERLLAEDLIFNRRQEALNDFVEYFSIIEQGGVKPEGMVNTVPITIEGKIVKCIFDRDKKHILNFIDEALKEYKAEDIINNILMVAMKDVGEKLDNGEMVLPFVLQSAEVMRKALEYLEKFIKKGDMVKGKILLATVFGDVHDIGKNLVKMILQNHGFTVIDLGKQVPIDKIIEEARKHKVDAVGLSALLVSTARHMQTCVQAMHDAGLEYPILIGGAPINSSFAKDISFLSDGSIYTGGIFYAKDAFTGLNIIQSLMNPAEKKTVLKEFNSGVQTQTPKNQGGGCLGEVLVKKELHPRIIPEPPFYGIRTLNHIPVDEVFSFLDESLLFNIAWGANLKNKIEKQRIIKEEYSAVLKDLKQEVITKGMLDLKAVYGYFKCHISAEEMQVLNEGNDTIDTITFKRSRDNLSLTDYFMENDLVCFQAVTVGEKISKVIEELSNNKEITKSFYLHGLGVYMAEAVAAYIHEKIRDELALDKDQGKRYSPGYPLWRNIQDQEKIFKILDIEKRLGIKLTQAYQMVPEQSTTAMIVYSKEAEY